jgi:hypothetical protein
MSIVAKKRKVVVRPPSVSSPGIKDFKKKEKERKNREIRMIHRRLGTDIQFRSAEHIDTMLKTCTLGKKPVKFFIISAHGSISRKDIFRMPSHAAVFDLGENEYRGRLACTCLEPPLLNRMIGHNGENLGNFFNAMLGGEYTPKPTSSMIQQVAYRTPGELAFDISLSLGDKTDDLFNALGCWDITRTISTFNPTNFTCYIKEGGTIGPNRSRFTTNPRDGIYWPETKIKNKMRRKQGVYLSEVLQILESQYPDTVCFVIVSCCMGIDSPELPNTIYPEQPSAYTHYALKGKAIGDPEVDLIPSMQCRVLDDYLIDYGTNKDLNMVLRSSNITECTF